MEQTASWPGWETVRLIGRGSFGAVYEIQRSLFGEVEKAALKVITIPQNVSDIEELRNEGFDKESITDTFKNHLKSIVAEYSLMRKMNGSANIVNCDDVRYVQHEDGIGWDIYIKMELLTPLTKTLPDAIPEETVIKIALDLCSALELCKKHDIVHRDIKPQNIFVSDNGDYKLGDFGIAKTVEKTMSGTKIGTYKYMAPEVYNNQPYGSAADIYSLGLVLYWMLNGRRMPFLPLPPAKLSAGMNEAARARRLAGEPVPAPKNGSEGLKAIVLKACAYEPKERYTDARQMKEALEHLSVTSERPEEKGTVAVRKPMAGKKVPVVPLREEVAESDATIVSAVQKPFSGQEQKNAPHAAPKKRRRSLIAAACILVGIIVCGSVFLLGKGSRQTEMAAGPTIGATTEVTTEAMTEAPTEDETARLDAAYAAAEQLLQAEKYDQAIAAFEALNGYKDSSAQIEIAHQQSQYAEAEALAQSGKTAEAAIAFYKLGDKQRSFALWDEVAVRDTISGIEHTVGINSDGTVVAVGDNRFSQCNVGSWKDIIAISAGDDYTVGLKSDGTVVAVGDNRSSQCNVGSWKDIVAVSSGSVHTVGLRSDGTVVAVGDNGFGQRDVSDWTNIVAVSAGYGHTVGLRSDGTVVAVGHNEFGQCDVSSWKDITAVSAGYGHTVGLKSDGTVVAAGHDSSSWEYITAVSADSGYTTDPKSDGTVAAVGNNCSSWKDIIAVSAGAMHFVGLQSDGTVVAVGNNGFGQCDVSSWKDIIAISAGDDYTVGLKSDGTVVAVGLDEYGRCDISGWKDMKRPPISAEHQAKLDEARQAFEAQQAADYAAAEELLQAGKYDQAIAAFEALNGYRNSTAQIEIARQQSQYAEAEALAQSGKTAEAAIAFYKLGDRQRSFALWDEVAIRDTISAQGFHTVGLKADGTVMAVGDNEFGQCDIGSWKDIIALSTSFDHTVGLKSDGTVVAVGDNEYGQCDVSDWKDIAAISAGFGHTVGLKADGTVVAVGSNENMDGNYVGQCDVSSWKDIIAVSAGAAHTVGLKSDGTVVAVGSNENMDGNYVGQCDVSSWKDIIAVSAGFGHTVGLRSDGTVVAVGDNEYGQCDVSSWKDIIAVSAGLVHTVGLKADGTTMASPDISLLDVSVWENIVAVSAGSLHTVGLKADGTVVAVGDNEYGQCDVDDWKNIKLPSSSEEMQNAANQSVKSASTEDVQSAGASGNSSTQASNKSQPVTNPTESTAPSYTPVYTPPTEQTVPLETSPTEPTTETSGAAWWMNDEIIPDEGCATGTSGN
ncbi:MAG: protein kinase [Clostridiales bacterium]|nr:protein kinase [Clostridiales bacterium]